MTVPYSLEIPFFISKRMLRTDRLYQINGNKSRIDDFVSEINQNREVHFKRPTDATEILKINFITLAEPLLLF